MRTRKALWAAALLLAGTAFAPAFDSVPVSTAQKAVAVDRGALAATRLALAAYAEGRKVEAAESFAVAAQRGHVPAQWKLARMLAEGDGVEIDLPRAASLYGAIADRFESRDPALRLVAFVADATREAGKLRLAGHAGPRDVSSARRLLWRAATTYSDAEARYALALSLMNEDHGPRQAEAAVGWLRSAVSRGHASAGVLLGELLVAGIGATADPVAGLLTIAQAVERAGEADRPSLALRFQTALAKADEATGLAVAAQMAALGLTAATAPVMEAAAD